MFKMLKNQKGMTLVELLAVMVIIGIIAAISIPAIGNLIQNSRKDAVVSVATSLVESARMYVAAEGLDSGTYTFTALNDTSKKEGNETVTADLVTAGYLDNVAKNPQDKEAYAVAQVTVNFADNKATYTVTLRDTANAIGTYDIINKTLENLKRENVGKS